MGLAFGPRVSVTRGAAIQAAPQRPSCPLRRRLPTATALHLPAEPSYRSARAACAWKIAGSLDQPAVLPRRGLIFRSAVARAIAQPAPDPYPLRLGPTRSNQLG